MLIVSHSLARLVMQLTLTATGLLQKPLIIW
eukprot:CCRYP_007290-RB/>CCRYP_007290-RB protein AED:0.42 eAED:1.00 QI:0/-1/0/1/-1/0/1/0/30